MPIKPPIVLPTDFRTWTRFLRECVVTADIVDASSVTVPSYTVATLPSVTSANVVFVSNETGGATLAFSDGVNWRRVQDRNIVS